MVAVPADGKLSSIACAFYGPECSKLTHKSLQLLIKLKIAEKNLLSPKRQPKTSGTR